MSYMERLKAKISETCPPDEPTQLTEPGFVSSVSSPSEHVYENSALIPPASAIAASQDKLALTRPRNPLSQPDEPCDWEAADPDISGGWGLPTGLFWRIRRLNLNPAGRQIENRELWPGLVIDTTLFAKNGWATKALALGWSEAELFAISEHGQWLGLTARLYGNAVVALDADGVTVRDHRGPFRLPRTRPTDDATLIWELGQ